MNTNRTTFRAVRIVLVVAMLGSTGCAKFSQWKTPKALSLDNTWPFRDKDAPHEGIPTRIVGTWTDTVLTQPGQKPQRGLGGRLMFYEHEGKKPVLVDGQLVVYAFDETGRDPTDNKPTRRYVFPADQMPMHMSKSELGASYSFWLPWDEAGGARTEVSLICRFEPKGGAIITGEQTKHLLPGTVPSTAASTGPKPLPKLPEGVPSKPVRQTLEGLQSARAAERNTKLTSYEVPATGEPQSASSSDAPQAAAAPERRMTATTITLPNNFQMPDAAALRAAVPPASYPPAAAQAPQQFAPNPAQWQQSGTPTRTYVLPPMPAAPAQPTAIARPFMGTQPQPLQFNSQAPMFPNSTSTVGPPTGWNNVAASQVARPQHQQPIQQQMMQQSVPAQQSWPQMPVQGGAATATNYPLPVQYPR